MKQNPSHARMPCPCGSELPYPACCGQWHQGAGDGPYPPTPEVLMRSRYSAYVLGRLDYLLATWHPSSAPGDLELPAVKWLGLEVRAAHMDGDAGVVEFVARCRDGAGVQRMHEISRFVRTQGRWYYIDGESPPTGGGLD